MNEAIEEVLEKNGWIVDCWSPFEITKTITDSNGNKLTVGFAEQEAAQELAEYMLAKDIEEKRRQNPLSLDEPCVERPVPCLTYKQWLVGQILAGAVHKDGGPDSLAIRAIAIAESTITQLREPDDNLHT